MELDDFKNIPFPEKYGDNVTHKTNPEMETLYEEIRSNDKKDRRKISLFSILITALTLTYFSSFTRSNGVTKEGLGFLILSFILILVYLFFRYLQSRKINYTEPVVEFLRKAKKRYSYMPFSELIFIIPLLFMMITSGGFVVWGSFSKYMDNPLPALLIYAGLMAVAVIIGLWAGKKQWEKEKSHIYMSIQRKLDDFSSGEN